jgi:hypothetical protein
VIVGLVTTIVFAQRAREMARILAKKNILAQWIYNETQSQQQIQQEFSNQIQSNHSTFSIVIAWFIVIGGAILGIDLFTTGEMNWFFALLFFGILILISLVALVAPIIWRRQAFHSSHEVIIAHNGVVLNGALYTWVPPLCRLENVSFINDPAEKTLKFEIGSLSSVSMTMYSTSALIIPVPGGKEPDAQRVVDYFLKQYK